MPRRYPRTGNPGGRGIRKTRADVRARVEDALELAARGEDIEAIAARLGVCCRTVHRYMARVRAEGVRP